MDEVEEIDTDRPKSPSCQKKAVALNILITVDRQKDKNSCNDPSCCRGTKKCKPKVKVKRTQDACCGGGGSSINNNNAPANCVPQSPVSIPPNSEMLPCGCLIVYDQQKSSACNQEAGVQCCRSKRSRQRKCSRARSGQHCPQCCATGCQISGQDQDQYPCIRVKVKKKSCCNKTTACCQTTGVPTKERMEKGLQNDVSVQAFQSQRSIVDLPPPPSVKPSIKPSKSKCSRISVMPSSSQNRIAPSTKSTRVIVPPQMSGKPSVAPSFHDPPVSTKATQHVIISPPQKSESSVMQPQIQSVVKVEASIVPSKAISVKPSASAQKMDTTEVTEVTDTTEPTEVEEVPPPPPSKIASEAQPVTEDAEEPQIEEISPPAAEAQSTTVSVIQSQVPVVQSYHSQVPLALPGPSTDGVSYVEEIPDQLPDENEDDDECNECDMIAAEAEEECEEACEEDDGCFTFSWSTLRRFDWEKWDKFVSLLNGEPTCVPNLCEQTCGCEEEEEEEEEQPCNDGWNNSSWGNYNGCSNDCDTEGGALCQAEPMGQETYVLLIALPLVFLGLMASFKTSTC